MTFEYPEARAVTFQYPEIWPQCSGCGMAWRMVRRLSFKEGWLWVWEQDCKHGRKGSAQPTPVMADSVGPLKTMEE